MSTYLTLDELYDRTPDTDWGSDQGETLKSWIEDASRAVDTWCVREAGAFAVESAEARLMTGSGGQQLWVGEMAAAPDLVEVDETSDLTYVEWASSDYICWPYNALLTGRPYKRIDIDVINGDKRFWYAWPRGIRITAKWGYSTEAPPDIQRAVIMQCLRWYKRAQQLFQDTGGIIDLGQLSYTKRIDPEVSEIVKHYRRAVV